MLAVTADQLRRAAAIVAACALVTMGHGLAAEVCRPLAGLPAEVLADRWIQLTPEQWQFVRGLFVLNPNTPAGLPYGDKAALVQRAGDKGGVVVFIDGDKGCTPMPMPADGVDLLMRVGTGEIAHEGTPN